MKIAKDLLSGRYKKVQYSRSDTVEASLQEFMKWKPNPYLATNQCAPTIRFKQELHLPKVISGIQQENGFSAAAYYENSLGYKIPVCETFGATLLEPLTRMNERMPYGYPSTTQLANIEKFLQEKDNRITFTIDPGLSNGVPNILCALSTVDNPYINGNYDPDNLLVLFLGTTNIIDAIKLADEFLPAILQFKEENPETTIFSSNMVGDTTPVKVGWSQETAAFHLSEMPEQYDIQGELAAQQTESETVEYDMEEVDALITSSEFEHQAETAMEEEKHLLEGLNATESTQGDTQEQ